MPPEPPVTSTRDPRRPVSICRIVTPRTGLEKTRPPGNEKMASQFPRSCCRVPPEGEPGSGVTGSSGGPFRQPAVTGGHAQVRTVDIALPEVEELQKLVETGKEKGFLTYDEIVSGVDELELSKEQLEDFTTYLIDHGVELVEGEQHKSLPHEQPLVEEEKSSPKLELTVEPSLDSLRLYLREIGKVPL